MTALTTTQAIDALVARKPVADLPLDTPLTFGVQAQADAAVQAVPAERFAMSATDMNGKPIFAGYGYRVGSGVRKFAAVA